MPIGPIVRTDIGVPGDLKSFDGASVDLGEGAAGHYMGCGVYLVDQVPADGSETQWIVLIREDLETLLAWVG